MQSLPASPPSPTRQPSATWQMALKVAGIYAGVAAGWIVISDFVLARQAGAPSALLRLEIGKGLAFVAVTSALLVLLVRHYLRQVQQAEGRLGAGEMQFRLLLEQSLVGVYLIQDDRFAYVNPRMAEIFGYSPAELLARVQVTDLVAETDRPRVLDNLARRLRGDATGSNFSFRGLHRGGEPLQVEVFDSRIEHQGRPAIMGTLIDVTDRGKAETALRESEMHLRLLVQTAPDAIVVLDLEHGRFVDFNEQAERLFELSGKELGRHGPVELSPEIQPDGRRSADSAAAYVAEAMAGGVPTFEWTHRSATGRIIPCEIRLVRLPAQGRTLIRGSITDITGRRRAAEALARSEENYRQLFEQGTDAILLCDAGGRLVDLNRHALSLTGFTREELMQKDAFALLAPEDHDSFRRCLQEQVKQGSRINTFRYRRKDGSVFFGESSTKLLPDGRLLALVRDISEHRQAEEHRLKLEEELRQAQKLQAIGTLAGGIAHDFNNILAAILGNAQLLKVMLPPEHEAQGKVAQVLAASNRAKDLVQQILMFSRQRVQDRRELQLAAIVVEAVRLVEVNLPAAVRLELAASRDLPTVLADPTQIHQVVVNLCTNALHAMRDGGGILRVALSVVSLPEDDSQSKPGLPPGRYVCLRVSDTGHGMSAATLQRIYEPFFTTKPVGDGTGLGLAVVHGIVEAHNGGIAVASEPGSGTTFSLFFPAEAATAVSTETKPATPGLVLGQNQHILLVDDEIPITEVAKLMLQRLDYRVTVFTNPREALEFLRQNAPSIDLLMSDLSMPGLSGVDLIREAIRLKPSLPALLLTGYGKRFDSRAAVSLNIHEVIAKPFTMEILGHALQGALERKP